MTNKYNREMKNPSSPPCTISGKGELMITNGQGKDLELAIRYIHREELR
jgi:hypothetical protein